LTAWKKRKRLCMDLAEPIAEGVEKKPRLFLEDLGCELDEEFGMNPADVKI